MNRRNEKLFRRLDEMLSSGIPYADAWAEEAT
jgi:hypothetical protein